MAAVCKICNHLKTDDPHVCPTPEYEAAKRSLMQGALEAEEMFSDDELEEFAREQERKNDRQVQGQAGQK